MSTRREEARRARAEWPVRVYRLGEEPPADLAATTTAEERLAMVWPITVDTWTLAGLPIPDYPRDQMPVRIEYRKSPPGPVKGGPA